MPTVSIVMPVYNERRTLLSILCRVLAVDLTPLGLSKDIIVVDDCSTDGTRDIVSALATDWRAVMREALARRGMDVERALHGAGIRCLLQPQNRGKGAALKTGFQAVAGEFTLIQDADLEYDPQDYPRLLAPLVDGRADAVYGSRFLGAERRVLLFWHSVGNRLLTLLSNMINDLNLTDMETCYKAFRSEVICGLRLKSERFGFEPEVTAKLAKMRYRIYEVPVSYSGRGYEAGKKITWKDGVEAVWCIVKHGFTSDVVEGAVLEETLQKMRGIRRLNEHIFRTIRPWLGRRILEAGSGHGNITDHLLGCGDVIASDVDDTALARLGTAYAPYDNIIVLRWDMTDPLPESTSGGPLDTIVCLNVLEHIADDRAALVNARSLLEKTRGRLVLLVPAHPSMFSPLDKEMGHYRRYSRRMLKDALLGAGFEIERLQWLNLLGLPGWWVNAKILRRDRLSAVQIVVYRLIARFWLPIERLTPPPTGLSLVGIARPRA